MHAELFVEPAGHDFPAAHMLQLDATVRDHCPTGHCMHDDDAGILLYCPAVQLEQAVPPKENLPTVQFVQAVIALDDAGHDFPAGHREHDAEAVGAYCPMTQLVQLAAADEEYFPEEHAVQDDPVVKG